MDQITPSGVKGIGRKMKDPIELSNIQALLLSCNSVDVVAWIMIAPLGVLVLPDVNTMYNQAEGLTVGRESTRALGQC